MVFSSLEFLFYFFPIVFIGYLLIKPKLGNIWLLCASLVFYYLGASEYLDLLLSIILIAYFSGILQDKIRKACVKKAILIISVFIMLLVMIYYKYWNSLYFNLSIFFDIKYRNVVLPIGISFFIFQAISYVVDVYRGEKPLKNPIDMGLYISFFPQLIAGPIVRFHDISTFFDTKYRSVSLERVSEGVWRFALGLCKKVLLANNLGGLANLVFGVENITQYSVLYTWLGALAYTLQIYYDFSGYSDMAIGLGKVFGFEFQENFNYPYFAGTIKEFWRRWHISLSQFFRDYVYIPLGGNRCTMSRWLVNILVVWFSTGLWHGSSWNYIIWGLSYGVLLLLERFAIDKLPQNLGIKIIRRILTIVMVMILWVIFRCEHMPTAIVFLKNMFGISGSSLIDNAFRFQLKNFALLISISCILALPIKDMISAKVKESIFYKSIITIGLMVAVFSSISYIYMGSYNPFLYFMF